MNATMIALLIIILNSILMGFTAGILVHRRHADKIAKLEAKAKAVLAALKGDK